jgi:glycosyltransferase involved in cell wall biosynthesis
LRVAYLFPSFIGWNGSEPEILGGAETHFLELSRALSRHVDVIAISFGNREEEVKFGRLTVRLYRASTPIISANGRCNPVSLHALRDLETVDIVQCQGLYHDLTLVAAIYCRLRRRPLVLKNEGWNGLTVARYLKAIRYADAVASQSKQESLSYGPKGVLCYDGVDTDFFTPPTANEVRDQFLFVGRLFPHKGVEVLIDAARRTGRKTVIAGPVPDAEYLSFLKKRAVDAPVFFLGPLSKSELRAEQRRSLALVMPYLHRDYRGHQVENPELFGLVGVEAIACGTPIVCSAFAAPSELVRDFRLGYVFPERDAFALARVMDVVWRNRGDRSALESHLRTTAVNVFSWNVVAKRYLELYHTLLQRSD